MILEIKKYPDPVLRKKASPVENIDAEIQMFIDDMFETLYSAPGIGLAATQVGELKRIIVIDIGIKEGGIPPIALINPEIIAEEGNVMAEEGCLSVPEYTSEVKRAEKISVRGIGRDGLKKEFDAIGLLARAIQHEIDHLNGILFIDRISPLKRQIFKKRYRKKVTIRG
ncbi:MAG: peptide deformylase [Nitrospirota bacterium]